MLCESIIPGLCRPEESINILKNDEHGMELITQDLRARELPARSLRQFCSTENPFMDPAS
jgi:hypothetical protein